MLLGMTEGSINAERTLRTCGFRLRRLLRRCSLTVRRLREIRLTVGSRLPGVPFTGGLLVVGKVDRVSLTNVLEEFG